MNLLEIIQSILGFGLDLFSILFRLMLFAITRFVMDFKNRNGLLWGAFVFFFPWAVLFLFWVPRRMPRLGAAWRRQEAFRDLNPVVASIMALSAMVAKSDGRVSETEIGLVRQFVSRQFGLSAADLNRYKGAFEYGKAHPEDHPEFCRVLRSYYPNRMTLLGIAFLFIGLEQKSEGADPQLLGSILAALGIGRAEYEAMKNAYQGGGRARGSSFGSAPRPANDRRRYAQVLGVEEDASQQDIKSAYRRIMKEYHPDKVASKGMPPDYVAYANRKVKEANEAYEVLSRQKGA